jgi:hypothetical protein
MKNFNKAFKQYLNELIYFAGTNVNVRLVYTNYNNRFCVTVFYTDSTIINLMKGEIIC